MIVLLINSETMTTDLKDDEDTCPNPALYQPHLPILQDTHRMKQLEKTYGHYFKDDEQFEAFAMLPLSDTQRPGLIRSLVADAKMSASIYKDDDHSKATNI